MDKKYQIIYADPAWSYYNDSTVFRNNENFMKKQKQKYKKVSLETDMGNEALKEMLVNAMMLDKKHQDYGAGNISRFGLRGIVVRLNDKIERLATLTDEKTNGKEAKFESIEDSLRDISNYATIGLLCMKNKWK